MSETTERQKALSLAISSIERQFGKGSIMRLGDGQDLAVPADTQWWEGGTDIIQRTAVDSLADVQDAMQRWQCVAGIRKQYLWFSIASRTPAQSKRAMRGTLQTSDIGISVHRPLMVNRTTREIVLDVESHHVRSPVCRDTPRKSPLVFSAAVLSLDALKEARFGTVQPRLAYMLDIEQDPPLRAPPEGCQHHTHSVLKELLSDESFRIDDADIDAARIRELMRHYQEQGLVQEEFGVWSLTADGLRRARVGNVVTLGALLLRKRKIPLQDMSRYELKSLLGARSWEC